MTQNKNKKFNHRLDRIPSEIIDKLTQIHSFRGQWIAGAQLSPQVLDTLKQSVLVTSTGSSTRIEGSRLSNEDVRKLMRGLSLQKFRDRDKQEVQGYYELLENVFASWQTIRLNESTIKHFHKELLKYTEKDEFHRGEYKKKENKVHMVNKAGESMGILFDTTSVYLAPKEMQELVEWTNDAIKENTYHPLLVIGNFVIEFLKIHPFEDGNGRLSRILTNLLFLQTGYEYTPYISHEKLIEDNKPEYYLALRECQNTMGTKEETIIPWLTFFLDLFLQQSQMAVELLSAEHIEMLLSEKQLAVWKYIEGHQNASPSEISKQTGVAYGTVRQAIEKLLRLKKIERIGQGRGTRYRKVN